MMSLYLYVRTWLQKLKTEEGQDLVEYALLLGLIAIVAVAAIIIAGEAVSTIWSTIADILSSVVANFNP